MNSDIVAHAELLERDHDRLGGRWAYLERWAEALGLRALLDRARAEAAGCP